MDAFMWMTMYVSWVDAYLWMAMHMKFDTYHDDYHIMVATSNFFFWFTFHSRRNCDSNCDGVAVACTATPSQCLVFPSQLRRQHQTLRWGCCTCDDNLIAMCVAIAMDVEGKPKKKYWLETLSFIIHIMLSLSHYCIPIHISLSII